MASFSSPVLIAAYSANTQNPDKNFAAAEENILVTYPRSYVAWTNADQNSRIEFSYTTNGGNNWHSPIQINSPSGACIGVDISTAPNGNIYLIWTELGTGDNENFAGFGTSTNRGDDWNVTTNVFDRNGVFPFTRYDFCPNGFTRIAVDKNIFGSRSGWIYVVSGENGISPAGDDPDIVLHRSTDGGLNWSSGIRVNQDQLNNDAYQWFPAICVDENGDVNVIFYDDRTGSDPPTANIYLARSTDGGNNWTEYLISSESHEPEGIPGSRQCAGSSGGTWRAGDYIGITTANGHLIPFWSDNRSGRYQIYSVIIEILKK